MDFCFCNRIVFGILYALHIRHLPNSKKIVSLWKKIEWIRSEVDHKPELEKLKDWKEKQKNEKATAKFTRAQDSSPASPSRKQTVKLSDVPEYIPLNDEKKEEYKVNSLPYKLVGEIPKIEWSPDQEFAKLISERGKPIVLKNTFVTQWPALHKWNLDYVKSKLGDHMLHNVYKHKSKIFGPYWDPHRGLATYPSIKRRNAHELINITASELFSHFDEENPSSFYYYSTNFNGVLQLEEDVIPMDWLEVNPDPQKQNFNFWIGMKGTIADTHYDAYENFNVQVYGRKKWTLFAPNDHLYLYPFFHPSHAQSQVVISGDRKTVLKEFPLLENARGFTVSLEPGEILYVPPLWFHSVEALDLSIAVNWYLNNLCLCCSWTFSTQSIIVKEAIKHAESVLSNSRKSLPSSAQMPIVVKSFIDLVLEETIPGSGSEFIEYLYESRYANLITQKQLPSSSKTPLCGETAVLPRKLLRSLKNDWQPTIGHIAELFSELPSDAGSVWLGNFVEAIVSIASGTPLIGYYLQDCYFESLI